MAQIKKLQNGGVPSSEPKKRIYNGVELTDDDINKVISYIGEWGTQNANYSEDIRKWSELATKTKDNLLQGNIPTFDPTGTSMGDVTPGKTNQNIFGNWAGQNLNRQFSSVLKNALDQITNKSNATTTIPSNSTLDKKFHKFASGLISNKYFAGNWENAQKGISEWDENTRKNRVREALLESINEYKNTYNENSPYFNTIDELNNPNITTERLKEIGYAMGTDVSDLLSGTTGTNGTTNSPDRYQNLKQFGTKVEDPYLKSKGLVAFRDNNGVTKLFNDSDLSEYNGEGGIETNYGTYYGYGMFKDPNKGWYFGDKSYLESISEINRNVAQSYSNIFNILNSSLNNFKNSANETVRTVDFSKEYSRFFNDPIYNKYRENNKFQFHDYTNKFQNLTGNDGRLIIPHKGINKDILGALDIENNQAFLIKNGKSIPLTIKIDRITNRATGTTQDGNTIDLGIFGDSFAVNSRVDQTFDYKYNMQIAPSIDYSDVKNEELVLFGTEEPISRNNITKYITNILNGRYSATTDKDVVKLAKITKKYLDKFPVIWNKETIKAINNKLSGMITNPSQHLSQNYKLSKKIKKAQAGATLSKSQESNIIKGLTPNLPILPNRVIKPEYGDLKVNDIGKKELSFADKADVATTALDAVSLIGGVPGVLAGVASTVIQGFGDYSRGGVNKDFIQNLGINLGFTALALIPGLSAAKFTKGAIKATKHLKDLEKATKIVEKGSKLTKNTKKVNEAKVLLEGIKSAKEVVKNENVIQTVLNNKLVRGGANAARLGMIGLGATSGINSAKNIYEQTNGLTNLEEIRVSDIRGLLGGVGAYKGIKGAVNDKLIKMGTSKPISEVELPRKVKVKGTNEEVEIGKYDKSNINQKIRDVYKEKALNKNKEIEELQAKRIDGKQDNNLEKQITKLQDEYTELIKLSNTAEVDSKFFNSIKNTTTGIKEKGKNWLSNNTDDWNGRKLKEINKNSSWVDKLAHKKARQAGFTKNGYQMTYDEVLSKLYPGKLMDLNKGESLRTINTNNRLQNIQYKKDIERILNLNQRPINKFKYDKIIKFPIKEKPSFIQNQANIKQEQLNNQILNSLSLNPSEPKFIFKQNSISKNKPKKPKYIKPDKINIKNMKKFGLIDNVGQTSMFKQGGRLIPKFQNSGEIISGQQLPPKNQIIGQEVITIPDEFVQPVVIETPIIYPNKVNTSNSSNLYIPNLTKRNFNFDSSLLRELPKLTNSLWTNKRNAQILSGIKPVLLQNPTEVYKPVITNLANENAVNNQVTSFLRRSSIPMTSDATLQKAGMLEAMSKVNPLLIQAKAENTNMYNQSLANSNESAEKYALERNKIANENRQRIGANEARLANIEAGKNIANNASWGNFFDKTNQIFERNQLYKYNLENQQKLQDLQREFEGKLKPFEEAYTKLNDKVNSDAYKLFLRRSGVNWDTDILDNGKTGAQLLKEEQEQKYKLWQDERNKLTPFYQNRMLVLNNSNPYLTTIKYKSGGELTAQTRVEVQRLRNKLKEKELDAKYIDKTLDRKQKEVQTILNGLSKETFFLLKTILGK